MYKNGGCNSTATLRRAGLSATVVIALLLSTAGAARAQIATNQGDMRINVFGTLGFGGEASGETEYDDDAADDFDFDDVDLDTTNGIGAEFDYALHRYFLIGGRMSFNSVDIDDLFEDDDERSMLVNLDVVPRGRLPVAGAPIEFHLALPIGPTFNFPNDDLEDNYPGDTDLGGGISWNVSLYAGLTYWFNETIGLFVEQGWYHQAFTFNGETEFAGQTFDFQTVGDFDQFAFNIGVSIGL